MKGFGYNKQASPERNIDLMKDEAYLRRIKKANYGKWYLTPEKFEKKNKRLDKEVSTHNKEWLNTNTPHKQICLAKKCRLNI